MAAIKDKEKYRQYFEDFKRDLQEEHVREWTELVVQWESDPCSPDPYDITPSGWVYASKPCALH